MPGRVPETLEGGAVIEGRLGCAGVVDGLARAMAGMRLERARARRVRAGGSRLVSLALGSALLLALIGLASSTAAAQAIVRRVPAPGEANLVDYRIFFRARGSGFYNLDLDRGLTPSGRPLFPVPQSDPRAQLLTYGDMRLRTDVAFNVPDTTVSIHMRVDVIDDLGFGSLPRGTPADSRAQLPPPGAFLVKRAWAQVITPFGLLAAGRIGSHWGMGMLTNGGDCPRCDLGDSADRVFFATSIADHIWTLSFDLTSIGPVVPRSDGIRFLDVNPADDVQTLTLAMLNVTEDRSRARRERAGYTTLEYGAFASYRWQAFDWSPSYLPKPQNYQLSRSQIVGRGYQALASDLWFRVSGPWGRIEAEGALIVGRFNQASVIPGVFLHQPVDTLAWGGALKSEFRPLPRVLTVGLDLGVASGDPAPGFGAFPSVTQAAGQPGDLTGAQIVPPFDMRADNFRFHPSYRIDRILFREIIGTVTDAFYLRPHTKLTMARHTSGTLNLSLAAVASWAIYASSTPGNDHALGLELDPTLSYENDEGWAIVADYAVLFPFAGLSNPLLGLTAQPAQLFRLSLWVTL